MTNTNKTIETLRVDDKYFPFIKNFNFNIKDLYQFAYKLSDLPVYQYANIFISFLVGIIFGRWIKNPIIMIFTTIVYEIILTYLFHYDRISTNWYIYRLNLTFAYLLGYIISRCLDNQSPFTIKT